MNNKQSGRGPKCPFLGMKVAQYKRHNFRHFLLFQVSAVFLSAVARRLLKSQKETAMFFSLRGVSLAERTLRQVSLTVRMND
jgi:hypothetical protein